MNQLFKMDLLSYSSGVCFALGWWVFVQAVLSYNVSLDSYFYGIICTGSFIMVSCIDRQLLYDRYDSLSWRARMFALIGISMLIGSCLGSVTMYAIQSDIVRLHVVWQNLLILFSSLLYWGNKSAESSFEYSIRL